MAYCLVDKIIKLTASKNTRFSSRLDFLHTLPTYNVNCSFLCQSKTIIWARLFR